MLHYVRRLRRAMGPCFLLFINSVIFFFQHSLLVTWPIFNPTDFLLPMSLHTWWVSQPPLMSSSHPSRIAVDTCTHCVPIFFPSNGLNPGVSVVRIV